MALKTFPSRLLLKLLNPGTVASAPHCVQTPGRSSARGYCQPRYSEPIGDHARVVDLRSDAVTKPGPAMRKAMAEAKFGDDALAEDPTVNG